MSTVSESISIVCLKKRPDNKGEAIKHIVKTLHPNNVHKHGYDFPALIKSYEPLGRYVNINQYQNQSIDFANPVAVKILNCALLKHHYGLVEWDIPDGFLCPPIPGRVDYIHYVAELLTISLTTKRSDANKSVKLLDIGTGANGIYALLACQIYGWQCVASDIDPRSLDNVAHIISKNPSLTDRLQLRLQHDKNRIFGGIVHADDYFDISVCNPPFHGSLEEALKSNQKKRRNLAANRDDKRPDDSAVLNFGGQKSELWCTGGESRFLRMMIKESKQYARQCRWFTSLISKSEHVKPALTLLRKLDVAEIKQIEMKQGNKMTRVLAWTFIKDE